MNSGTKFDAGCYKMHDISTHNL